MGHMGFLAETRLGKNFPHLARMHLHGHLDRAHIARFLNDLVDRQDAVRVGIADAGAPDHDAAGRGLDLRLRPDQSLVQRQPGDERLHRGARLKAVGQHTVAQLFTAEPGAPVRVVTRVVGQRQDFTGLGV